MQNVNFYFGCQVPIAFIMPEATPETLMAFRNNCIEAAVTQQPGYLYSADARQSSPAGASSTTRVSCGLIHFGGSAAFPTNQLQHIQPAAESSPRSGAGLPAARFGGPRLSEYLLRTRWHSC